MSWSLDADRFTQEALRPAHEGWEPRQDWFRVYQLPLDVADEATVQRALAEVKKHLAKTRAYTRGRDLLQHRHAEGAALLGNRAARAAHAATVAARRQKLAEDVRGLLAGGPAVPAAAVARFAAAARYEHTEAAITEAVAAVGGAVREPVALPATSPPLNWSEILGQLTLVAPPGASPSLWEYLERTPGCDPPHAPKEALQKRTEELRKLSGVEPTAEEGLIAFLKESTASGGPVAILRHEVLEAVARAALSGYRPAERVAQGLERRLAAVGLSADPAALAYAVWCRARLGDQQPDVPAWETAVDAAITDRNPRAALVLLDRPDLSAARKKLATRLRAQVDKLDAQLAEARGFEPKDPESAAQRYLEVLRSMNDEEARNGLDRCPPAPCTAVTVARVPDGVLVTWQPSPARAGRITYRVVRTTGRSPIGAEDGSTVRDGTAVCRVLDPDPPTGAEVHYGVVTQRDRRAADAIAVAAPLRLLGEVSSATLVADPEAIRGRWQPARGAVGVEVTRDHGGRQRRVRDVSPSGFRDPDAETGVDHEYTIRALYPGPSGERLRSDGIVLRGRREPLPQPVSGFAVRQEEDGTLLLTWSPPPEGRVEIRMTESAPTAADGVVPAEDVEVKTVLDVRSGSPATGRVRVAPPGRIRSCWLVPVTLFGPMAALGAAVRVDRALPCVRHLDADHLGRVVRLTWEWPDEVHEVQLLHRTAAAPTGAEDDLATRRLVTRAAYDSDGVRVEDVDTDGDHWFAIVPTALEQGRRSYGPMQTVRVVGRREATYSIRRKSRFGRLDRVVDVTWDRPDPLPEMQIVVRDNLRPRRPEDGRTIARVHAGPAPRSVGLTLPADVARPFLNVFSADPSVVVIPASAGDSGALR
jgi:hypothetical protein